MSVWMILVVAGILLVAALVLIIAVHILDLYTEQQCVHLQDLTQRSLQQNEDGAHFQYRCGESQLCCMCGTVRNRRSRVNNENLCLTKISCKGSPAGALFQPLLHAACGNPQSRSSSLDRSSELTRRKRIASGYQGRWFDGWGFFRRLQNSRGKGRGVEVNSSRVRAVEIALGGQSDFSALTAEVVPLAQIGQGLNLGSDLPFTATITASREAFDSSVTNTASPSASQSSENAGASKPGAPRRLVLEIIMSSSPREGQGSGLPRATGVRLRVDTNANLDGLANVAASTSSEVKTAEEHHASGEELEEDLPDRTVFTDGHVLTYEFSSGHDGADCVVNREMGPNMNAKDWEQGLEVSSAGESSNFSGLLHESDSLCLSDLEGRKCATFEEHSKSDIDSIGVSTISSNSLDQGSGSLQAVGFDSSATGSCKPRSHGSASAVHSSAKSKGKVEYCDLHSNSGSSLSTESPGTSVGNNLATLKSNQSQGCSGTSVEGLGSLRISALDDIAKSVVTKDCSKGVTAQIASALAALKVDSIGGNNVEIGPNVASGIGPECTDSPCASEQGDAAKEEAVGGEGSGSKNREEGEESVRVAHELEDYEDGSKKGKSAKKKKNRGRRNKAKTAAVAAAAAILEAQESVHGRQWTRITAEFAPAQGEVEVGCICGTTKGGCHTTACPYPFTPSGSMVQRKIKEQYDDLVRSNVARTLTLAQVGRFTTCLVEAKSALQQKSDTIQRRFTIAKSLLSKADKSSFDRLCGQMYGLEIEQKKLEEDTIVYNRLQEQLKLSPAYQKMLEYGRAHFELQPNTGQLIEKVDSEEAEISFEELLAREKKDSFWQKHGSSRASLQLF